MLFYSKQALKLFWRCLPAFWLFGKGMEIVWAFAWFIFSAVDVVGQS